MTDAEMMQAMADVLERYQNGEEMIGDYAEGYNNDDVIQVLEQYAQHLRRRSEQVCICTLDSVASLAGDRFVAGFCPVHGSIQEVRTFAEMASPEGQRIISEFPPEVIAAAHAVLDGLDEMMAMVDEAEATPDATKPPPSGC